MDKFLTGAAATVEFTSSENLKLLSWNIYSMTPASGIYKNRNKVSVP